MEIHPNRIMALSRRERRDQRRKLLKDKRLDQISQVDEHPAFVKKEEQKGFLKFYDKQYKKLLFIPFILLLLAFIPVTILFTYPALGDMRYYFYLALLTLSFVGVYLWKSTQQKQYTFLHNILKLLLLTGVFCLVFIDTSLLLEKVIDRLN